MTREEIENTPKIVDYMLSDALLLASRENLHKRLEKICKLAIKALEQEPFINKPCVSEKTCEHDKNVVLDKIRAEIESKYGQCDICEYFEDYDYEENDISEYRPIGDIADILQIIDEYKAEKEE